MSHPAEDLQLDSHRLWDAIAVIELAVDWLDGVALEEPHYVDGERVIMRPMMRSDITARLNSNRRSSGLRPLPRARDAMTAEQIDTCSKKVRGMARRSLDLIEAMYVAAKAAQPITGRGVGYKLFTRGLIASMARSEMQRVYRLLKEAREQGIIPWEWIVDETRDFERCSDLGRSRRICPPR